MHLATDCYLEKNRTMSSHDHHPQLGEKVVVMMAMAGDERAFHELVDRYQRRLTYYIRRMVGETDESFDILQQVWLTVFKRLSSLRAPEAFRVWLYKIAHDVAVNHLRKSDKRPAQLAEENVSQSEVDNWNEFEALENAELVHRVLNQLIPVHREVLVLRFLENLSLNEIAEVAACEVGTVKSRLHYAKAALRESFEGEGDD